MPEYAQARPAPSVRGRLTAGGISANHLSGIVFTKLASQLTSRKLAELAVIPVIFVVQTLVSYLASLALTYAFGLKEKRPRNFVVAMSVSEVEPLG